MYLEIVILVQKIEKFIKYFLDYYFADDLTELQRQINEIEDEIKFLRKKLKKES